MHLSPLAAFALTALAWAGVADAEPLSARAAQRALADGAAAWDVRPAGAALLPGAVRIGLQADWDDATLARAVSAAGIDLSRAVVVYGRAGDPMAQALVRRLSGLASGSVHWLVGGIDEWQASGLPTVAEPAARWPVPQHLVPLAVERSGVAQPAAAALRATAVPDTLAARL